MILPFSEQFTINFYLWEQRGRGWNLSETEVPLEPSFQPFHYDPNLLFKTMYGDPKETFVDSLMKGFLDELVSPSSDLTFESVLRGIDGEEQTSQNREVAIIGLNASIGPKIDPLQLEHFFISLSLSRNPIGFELVGTGDKIYVQLACFEADYANVEQQLKINFPSLVIEKKTDAINLFWDLNRPSLLIDFGLEDEFVRPLQSFSEFGLDPLTGLIGALEDVKNGELGIVQMLFQSTRHPWSESIIRSVSDQMGKSLFVNAPEMVSLAREKIKHPLFASVLRIAVQSSQKDRSRTISKNISAALKTTSRPGVNSLIPLSNEGYDEDDHIRDFFQRTTHRTGMILNAMEIATIVHPPSQSINSRKLQTEQRKSKAAPKDVIGHRLVLGENVYQGNRTLVSMSTEQRLRHLHIIGATGTGKSTLLLNLIRQDIEQGEGVAVLDPHGDLIEQMLAFIPERRYDDVILFDPSDEKYPIGFNILQARSEVEKNVLSSDLVEIFRKFSTSWGDQMTTVLGNTITAFLESETPLTLIDLRRFLIEKEFRESFIRRIDDESIKYFWEREFPLLKGIPQSSILTRLDTFLRPKLIRNIVGQSQGLDFQGIINGKKIFLAKLAQGIIGEENAYLLGSLLVSKIHQVTVGRQAMKAEQREPFYLYIDEFQHFITPSMASILSGGRKYHLGLTIAHQDLRQLFDTDTSLANSVISNAATRICFRLGDFDAQKLSEGFSAFDATDLQNLGIGEAIVRIDRKDHDFNLKTFKAPDLESDEAERRREAIIDLSRSKYSGYIERQEIIVPNKKDNKLIPVLKQSTPGYPEPKESIKPKEEQRNIIPKDDSQKNISQHRYLQTLIKKMAEQRGYRAVIEEPTPDGLGRVDVGLERDEKRIACEISVTTGDTQELHNIEKCLKAGYDPVIVCSQEKKNLDAIRKAMVDTLSPEEQSKVLFFEPDELFLFLDEQMAKEASKEERVKGYRVKVQYQAVSDADKKRKREAVAQVIGQALQRMKGR